MIGCRNECTDRLGTLASSRREVVKTFGKLRDRPKLLTRSATWYWKSDETLGVMNLGVGRQSRLGGVGWAPNRAEIESRQHDPLGNMENFGNLGSSVFMG